MAHSKEPGMRFLHEIECLSKECAVCRDFLSVVDHDRSRHFAAHLNLTHHYEAQRIDNALIAEMC